MQMLKKKKKKIKLWKRDPQEIWHNIATFFKITPPYYWPTPTRWGVGETCLDLCTLSFQ